MGVMPHGGPIKWGQRVFDSRASLFDFTQKNDDDLAQQRFVFSSPQVRHALLIH
jgi:hypothetical protein